MGLYYKATRPDGTDFYSGTIDYAAALASGETLRIDTDAEPPYRCCTPDVLHAADVPTETLIGGSWPCRLFVVTGTPVAAEGHKRGFRELRVTCEVEATDALGPQGWAIAALIERARRVTPNEADRLVAARAAAREAAREAAWAAARAAAREAAREAAGAAAWAAAGEAAWAAAGEAARVAARAAAGEAARVAAGEAARAAAWGAARAAAWGAAWEAAGEAARMLVARDLIGRRGFAQDDYDLLTGPWRQVIGPVHPDDAVIGGEDRG